MARLRVQKFDLETVKPHRSVLFVGRSGSGKSVCMRDWLRHLAPRFDAAIFFSPTLESANEFRRMVPSSFVWETPLDLGVINQICSMQRELLTRGKARDLLICADDCGYARGTWRANEVRFLLMNARHLRISFWASMQYAVDLPPDCRCQISYLVCTNENQHQYKKKLWNMFFGCVEKYALFDTTFSQITRDWRVAVLDQTDPSAELKQALFWYKADPSGPSFRIGKPVFWRLEREHRRAVTDDAMSIAGA